MEYGMCNEEARAEMDALLRRGHAPVVADPLAGLSVSDLFALRDEISRRLPSKSLAGLNLEEELVAQYHKTKALMDDVLIDDETPANQKAQVANAVVTALGQLVKLQEDLKRAEAFKIMESVLIDSIKVLPDAAKDEFYAEYERLARKAGLL